MIDGYSVYGDDSTDDCFGHGTHVSGIVGGLQYGVAKNVTIVPGKSGQDKSHPHLPQPTQDVIAGMPDAELQ